jgi:hypothetical protein
MDEVLTASSPVLFLFLLLLPGFLGVSMYGYIRETRSLSNFDRVVAAFALAFLSASIAYWFSLLCQKYLGSDIIPIIPLIPLGQGTTVPQVLNFMINIDLVWHIFFAIAIAGFVAISNNYGLVAKTLIYFHLSNRRSNYDVWTDVFFTQSKCWIRLDFKDGRTLTGWPKYYSKNGDPRELFIAEATWGTPDGAGRVILVDIDGPGVYIPNLSDIQSIAVLK